MVILMLNQKNKGLYNTEFEIIQSNNIVGKAFIEGKMGTMEAIIKGEVYNKSFKLNHANKILPGKSTKFRPYNIFEGEGSVGEIFQTEHKRNIFSKYEYTKSIYEGKEYECYPVGIGNKIVFLVYNENKQIAQIEKDLTIYNDLHNYKIYSINDTFITVLMCLYGYINSSYKPGEKEIKSVLKGYSKTFNKELLAKYNPNWINENA